MSNGGEVPLTVSSGSGLSALHLSLIISLASAYSPAPILTLIQVIPLGGVGGGGEAQGGGSYRGRRREAAAAEGGGG